MVSGMSGLPADARKRIEAAIAEAQADTHARFALVVVPASDRYQLYPVIWGAVLALLTLGGLAIVLPGMPLRFAFSVTVAVFLAASLLLEWRPLRLAIVPRHIRHAHARALAHREFAVRILSHPEHGGGVLFFASLAERYVEIVADHALHEAAGQAAWDGIVAAFTADAGHGNLAAGLATAVEACGALLAAHHPRT